MAFPAIATTGQAAAIYLAQRARAPEIDRFLLDLLLASEIFGFAWNIRATRRDVWPDILFSGAILFVIAAWLDTKFWYAAATALLAFRAFSHFRDARISRHRLKLMADVYDTLRHRVVSVSHLKRLIRKAEAAGAVWPAATHAMLDDISSRSMRI